VVVGEAGPQLLEVGAVGGGGIGEELVGICLGAKGLAEVACAVGDLRVGVGWVLLLDVVKGRCEGRGVGVGWLLAG
jgi:hypothetical protein